MSGIYRDESETFEINLSAACWSMGEELRDKFQAAGNLLNGVDWIVETDDALILIEFKDYSGRGMKIDNKLEGYLQKITRKYYFSAYYLYARGKRKVMDYVLIAEGSNIDDLVKYTIKASIHKRLPFVLQENPEISDKLIEYFEMYSVSEWNEKYPMFPLAKINKPPT